MKQVTLILLKQTQNHSQGLQSLCLQGEDGSTTPITSADVMTPGEGASWIWFVIIGLILVVVVVAVVLFNKKPEYPISGTP